MNRTSFALCLFLLLSAVHPLRAGEGAAPRAIRGVWLTNVDSDVLRSRANIEEAVAHCDSIGINTIFVVTWNKAMTTFPSAVAQQVTGLMIDSLYTGRDPLRELIDAAHRHGIKVVAWFEFGFSASYKAKGGTILQRKPEWKALDAEGRLATKNGFEWMNGFHPDVQDFMLRLVLEVVRTYDIDGIQGDDRLPAMPSESGYDPYTVARYQREHQGKLPPRDHKDTAWVQWRADILNAFMKRLHDEVKNVKPTVLISMAPSIYPWSKEEYLQDWPQWVRNGYVDQVIPQVYRYRIDEYALALKEIRTSQIDAQKIDQCYPGILLKVGKYHPTKSLLASMIKENRKQGFRGEVFFFYEGLKKYPAFFRSLYPDRLDAPTVMQ